MEEGLELLSWIYPHFPCDVYVYHYKEISKLCLESGASLGVHASLSFTYTAGILNTLFCFDGTPVKFNSIFPSVAPCRHHRLAEKTRGNGGGTPSGGSGAGRSKVTVSLLWHKSQHLLCLYLPDSLTGVVIFKASLGSNIWTVDTAERIKP